MIKSGSEWGEGLGVERDVKVNPAFRSGGFSGEIGEVSESGQGLGVEDDLMEIGGLVELLDGREGLCVPGVEGEGV